MSEKNSEGKKYIDAEHFKRRVMESADELNDPAMYDVAKAICEMVDFESACDVAPVVHGEWIERKSRFGGWHYDCPFCDDGFYMKERAKSKPNYCSNCGAKMDGGKK